MSGNTSITSSSSDEKNCVIPLITQNKTLPRWQDAAAGASAGAFSKTITAPIERIKLLVQLQHSLDKPKSLKQPSSASASSAITSATTTAISKTKPPPIVSSSQSTMTAWQVASSIYKSEGLLSFWRGNLPSVVRVSGTAAINFTMMNYYRDAAVRPLLNTFEPFLLTKQNRTTAELERRRKNVTSLVAGGMAGGTATTLLYPLEFLRTRLAADLAKGHETGTYKYRGMSHALASILQTDGIRGLFQGYGIALVGGIFYRVMFLGGYDVLKSETERSNQEKVRLLQQQQFYKQNSESSASSTIPASDPAALTWGQRLVIAQTVSLTAGTISYPLDSVRRRLMMQAGKPQSERKYRHSMHCIRLVLQQEGLRGFFLGIGPNILRSVSGALLLVAYDAFKQSII